MKEKRSPQGLCAPEETAEGARQAPLGEHFYSREAYRLGEAVLSGQKLWKGGPTGALRQEVGTSPAWSQGGLHGGADVEARSTVRQTAGKRRSGGCAQSGSEAGPQAEGGPRCQRGSRFQVRYVLVQGSEPSRVRRREKALGPARRRGSKTRARQAQRCRVLTDGTCRGAGLGAAAVPGDGWRLGTWDDPQPPCPQTPPLANPDSSLLPPSWWDGMTWHKPRSLIPSSSCFAPCPSTPHPVPPSPCHTSTTCLFWGAPWLCSGPLPCLSLSPGSLGVTGP